MIEDIEITRNEKGDQIVDTHPAFGLISLTRTTSNGAFLAGSSVQHGQFLALDIREAERHHSYGGKTNWFSKKSLIRIYISPDQLSNMLMNVSASEGVPCTIVRFNGEGRPGIKAMDTPVTEAINHMSKKLKGILGQARGLVKKVQNVCATTPGIKKADKDELKSLTTILENEITSNIPFAAECFAETMEETVHEAKSAVEAFIHNSLLEAGMSKMLERGESPIQIDHLQDEIVVDVEVLPDAQS